MDLPSKDIILELENTSLQNHYYKVTSARTPRYNCIAWAAGDLSRPWWPIAYPHTPPYYWPCSAEDETIQDFIQAFQNYLGYEECLSRDFEEGYEKVAIFVSFDDPEEVTHMARQLSSGLWTSKCGDRQDIEHDLEGLENTQSSSGYGIVTCIMKRPLSDNVSYPDVRAT